MLARFKMMRQRQMFFPDMMGVFFNPFYFARKGLSQSIVQMSRDISGDLLDVGCGTKPYKQLFDVSSYTGLDIDSALTRELGIADNVYDGGRFPYDDGSFDSALCNQVLEHVFNPDEFLQEIRRVLKSKGRLLLTVPFVWDEHSQPYDYARYSSFGLRALLESNGFVILQHKKLVADASILFQLTNAYLYKITQSWPNWVKHCFMATVMAFINVTGVIAAKILPGNSDLFLDNLVLAEKRS